MDYQKYMQGAKDGDKTTNLVADVGGAALEPVPRSAADCKTEAQLKAWRKGQESHLQYVPADYRDSALAPIQQEYEKQLARIKGGPMVEPVPASAADCKTEAQLEAWRKGQESQMQYVPAAFRQNALGPIRQEYAKNLLRIRAATKEAAKIAVNSSKISDTGVHAGSDDDATQGGHSDKTASAVSALKPPTLQTSDSADSAGRREPASNDGARSGSTDNNADSEAPEAKADDSTGDTTSAADASVAGTVLDLAQSTGVPSGTPRLLLVVSVGLALPACIAFAARAMRRGEVDNLETPFLNLDTVA
mmetsp:Transcript_52691/g.138190  ORF Transcript_52691/g.138190 Transcript_52691/m.138190 type:complete len:305 (+) Transcript_52691:1-915(+)